MASKASNPIDRGRIQAVLTCPGDLHDPHFPAQCQLLFDKLQRVLHNEEIHVLQCEPWNSVKITFDLPVDAAKRLKQLAESDDQVLRQLGILSVQIQGGQIISITLSGDNEAESSSSEVAAARVVKPSLTDTAAARAAALLRKNAPSVTSPSPATATTTISTLKRPFVAGVSGAAGVAASTAAGGGAVLMGPGHRALGLTAGTSSLLIDYLKSSHEGPSPEKRRRKHASSSPPGAIHAAASSSSSSTSSSSSSSSATCSSSASVLSGLIASNGAIDTAKKYGSQLPSRANLINTNYLLHGQHHHQTTKSASWTARNTQNLLARLGKTTSVSVVSSSGGAAGSLMPPPASFGSSSSSSLSSKNEDMAKKSHHHYPHHHHHLHNAAAPHATNTHHSSHAGSKKVLLNPNTGVLESGPSGGDSSSEEGELDIQDQKFNLSKHFNTTSLSSVDKALKLKLKLPSPSSSNNPIKKPSKEIPSCSEVNSYASHPLASATSLSSSSSSAASSSECNHGASEPKLPKLILSMRDKTVKITASKMSPSDEDESTEDDEDEVFDNIKLKPTSTVLERLAHHIPPSTTIHSTCGAGAEKQHLLHTKAAHAAKRSKLLFHKRKEPPHQPATSASALTSAAATQQKQKPLVSHGIHCNDDLNLTRLCDAASPKRAPSEEGRGQKASADPADTNNKDQLVTTHSGVDQVHTSSVIDDEDEEDEEKSVLPDEVIIKDEESKSGTSPPASRDTDSHTHQGEDSGIESTDTLSEKSPNQGENPFSAEDKLDRDLKEFGVSESHCKVTSVTSHEDVTQPDAVKGAAADPNPAIPSYLPLPATNLVCSSLMVQPTVQSPPTKNHHHHQYHPQATENNNNKEASSTKSDVIISDSVHSSGRLAQAAGDNVPTTSTTDTDPATTVTTTASSNSTDFTLTMTSTSTETSTTSTTTNDAMTSSNSAVLLAEATTTNSVQSEAHSCDPKDHPEPGPVIDEKTMEPHTISSVAGAAPSEAASPPAAVNASAPTPSPSENKADSSSISISRAASPSDGTISSASEPISQTAAPSNTASTTVAAAVVKEDVQPSASLTPVSSSLVNTRSTSAGTTSLSVPSSTTALAATVISTTESTSNCSSSASEAVINASTPNGPSSVPPTLRSSATVSVPPGAKVVPVKLVSVAGEGNVRLVRVSSVKSSPLVDTSSMLTQRTVVIKSSMLKAVTSGTNPTPLPAHLVNSQPLSPSLLNNLCSEGTASSNCLASKATVEAIASNTANCSSSSAFATTTTITPATAACTTATPALLSTTTCIAPSSAASLLTTCAPSSSASILPASTVTMNSMTLAASLPAAVASLGPSLSITPVWDPSTISVGTANTAVAGGTSVSIKEVLEDVVSIKAKCIPNNHVESRKTNRPFTSSAIIKPVLKKTSLVACQNPDFGGSLLRPLLQKEEPDVKTSKPLATTSSTLSNPLVAVTSLSSCSPAVTHPASISAVTITATPIRRKKEEQNVATAASKGASVMSSSNASLMMTTDVTKITAIKSKPPPPSSPPGPLHDKGEDGSLMAATMTTTTTTNCVADGKLDEVKVPTASSTTVQHTPATTLTALSKSKMLKGMAAVSNPLLSPNLTSPDQKERRSVRQLTPSRSRLNNAGNAMAGLATKNVLASKRLPASCTIMTLAPVSVHSASHASSTVAVAASATLTTCPGSSAPASGGVSSAGTTTLGSSMSAASSNLALPATQQQADPGKRIKTRSAKSAAK